MNNDPDRYDPSSGGEENTMSPYRFGWIALIIILVMYIFGQGVTAIAVLPHPTVTPPAALGLWDIPPLQVFLFMFISQVLFLLAPTLYVSRFHPLKERASLRLYRAAPVTYIRVAIGIFCAFILSHIWHALQSALFEQLPGNLLDYYHAELESLGQFNNLLRVSTIPEFVIGLLLVAVIVPICEEFLFRGLTQRSFEEKLSPGRAMFLAGFLFSLVHGDATLVIPLIGLGSFLGFMAWSSGSIWPAVVGHGLFNSLSFVQTNLPAAGKSAIAESNPLVFSGLAVAATIPLYYVIRKQLGMAPTRITSIPLPETDEPTA